MNSPGGGREVVQRLSEVLRGLAAATEPDPALAPEQRLRASMAAYFAYVQANEADYRRLYEGADAADPEVRALVAAALERQSERLLGILAPDVRAREMVRFAVHGWFRFLIAVCLRWLDDPAVVDRDAISDLCVDTLFSSVAAATRAAAGEEAW